MVASIAVNHIGNTNMKAAPTMNVQFSYLTAVVITALLLMDTAHGEDAALPDGRSDSRIAQQPFPEDFLDNFSEWQRAAIVDDMLVRATGKDGVLHAISATGKDLHLDDSTRTFNPLFEADLDILGPLESEKHRRLGPMRSLPPLQAVWDTDGETILVIQSSRPAGGRSGFFGRMFRFEALDGDVRPVAPAHRPGMLDGPPEIGRQFPLTIISLQMSAIRRPTPDYDGVSFPFFSIVVEPERSFTMLIRCFSPNRLQLVRYSEEGPSGEVLASIRDDVPQAPFNLLLTGENYFLLRQCGSLEHVHENSLEKVGDFSRIPDWVKSEPSTWHIVQDRDQDRIRFFWGVSGYAELHADPIRFEVMPATPLMEKVRDHLLNPPPSNLPDGFFDRAPFDVPPVIPR